MSISTPGLAQDINLGSGGADLIWRGEVAHSRAGLWLDQGAIDSGDSRRDLIVGVPGTAGVGGKVYVLLGGPTRTGELSLANAEAVVSGPGAGDFFGTATAAGNVIDLPNQARRSLIVGAPGASGGRGVVYLFAGNITRGASLTPANAVLTVTGAAGDNLGTALATADLDGDGYREIIMGAPGNGRAYILYGGAGLSGARTPDVTIQGPSGVGMGSALAAGDITDDGFYDVLFGIPGQSLVYMIKGQGRWKGRLPANMVFSRDEDAYFYGVPGDHAGTSLFVGDLNGDNKSDLAIGAPFGGTAQAGTAYVLLGNSQRGALSLTQADLALYGPEPGARLGSFVSMGDMNRDGEDDLAMVTSGGQNGAGEVLVYYGRKGSLGTPGPYGYPVADLSNPSNVSRRIIGDGNGGPIASCAIFEVTGEGARDVIVGAPDSNSSSGAESGLVYFSNSPRLSVPSSTVYFAALQGGSSSTSIQVRNQSTVWITWSARARAAWQTIASADGASIGVQPGSFVVTGDARGLAPGRYDDRVTVTSTSNDLEMFRDVPITLGVFAQPTLTANKPLPAQAQNPITFTANTSAGTLNLLYEFWRYDQGTGWRRAQAYSSSNTYTWTPTAGDVGDHYLQVWVKSTLSAALYDVYAALTVPVITPTPVVHSFTADTLSPAALGSTIVLTANASEGLAPLQYQFYGYKSGQGWTLLRAWGPSNSFAWTPSSTGIYSLQVWIRNSGSTAMYDAWAGMPFEVSTTAPLQVTSPLAADAAYPLKVGSTVTWTAAASGGTAGPLQYQFWRYNAGTGAWSMVRDYGTSPKFTWTLGAGDEGSYGLQVWVRNAGSTARFDGWAATPAFSVERSPVVVQSLQADKAFPVTAGTTVTWTATAIGGLNLQYQFYVYNATTGAWSLLRAWGAGNSATWTPAKGTYAVQVWVRSSDSTATYDAWKGTAANLIVQ